MSILKKQAVVCPKCGKSYQETVFKALTTDFSDDTAKRVAEGKMFETVCPACGFAAQLDYELMYHDIEHQTMIQVIHPGIAGSDEKIESLRTAMSVPGICTRLVPDIRGLCEKAVCLENGRDDRIIELCKFVMEAQLPERYSSFTLRRALYTMVNGKEAVCFLGDGDERPVGYLEDSMYATVGRLAQKVLEQELPRFAWIDREWAFSVFDEVFPDDEDEVEEAASEKAVPPQTAFCRICGTDLLPQSNFCRKCGTKIQQ